MENLTEGLMKEIARNRELLEEYRSIGQSGIFGAAAISAKLKTAEDAIANQDVVAMLQAYQELKRSA